MRKLLNSGVELLTLIVGVNFFSIGLLPWLEWNLSHHNIGIVPWNWVSFFSVGVDSL